MYGGSGTVFRAKVSSSTENISYTSTAPKIKNLIFQVINKKKQSTIYIYLHFKVETLELPMLNIHANDY
ncbi:hypothetical protein EI761_01935 [Salmonella enterica]|nr:hypothetical protein [Salmonella enterica]